MQANVPSVYFRNESDKKLLAITVEVWDFVINLMKKLVNIGKYRASSKEKGNIGPLVGQKSLSCKMFIYCAGRGGPRFGGP